MKKTFKNFLLLTLGIAIGSTAIIMAMFELIGAYTYFVLVTLFFTSMATVIIKDIKN
jgi:hypothetical protein